MFTLNCKGRLLAAEHPLVMGIINLTPDSFYEDSRADGADAVLRHTERMLEEGADIIDIGAQSTRPGSIMLTEEQELSRLSGIVDIVTDKFPEAIFSIDTYYSRVAALCVAAGASMINDITGGERDAAMMRTVAGLHVPYVCMHMRGNPETMHEHTSYDDVTKSVLDYFIMKIRQCREAGIKDVIADPGFGFSKNARQNFELLKNLRSLKILGVPLLAGLSRKSTIYKTLGVSAADALNGTTVMNTVALLHGADLLRVHDVKEAKEAIKLASEVFK
jgi:dihydropteroate synthase